MMTRKIARVKLRHYLIPIKTDIIFIYSTLHEKVFQYVMIQMAISLPSLI